MFVLVEDWLEISSWGGTLMITAYLMGTLYKHKNEQIAELRDTYNGILMILRHFISKDKYTENQARVQQAQVHDQEHAAEGCEGRVPAAVDIRRGHGRQRVEPEQHLLRRDHRVEQPGQDHHGQDQPELVVHVLQVVAQLRPDCPPGRCRHRGPKRSHGGRH